MIQFSSQIILCCFCCHAFFLSLSDMNPYTIHSFDSVAQHHAVYCIVSLYTHTHTIYCIDTTSGAATIMSMIGTHYDYSIEG